MWRGYYNIVARACLPTDVFAIVNPLSGAGAKPGVAAARVALLTAALRRGRHRRRGASHRTARSRRRSSRARAVARGRAHGDRLGRRRHHQRGRHRRRRHAAPRSASSRPARATASPRSSACPGSRRTRRSTSRSTAAIDSSTPARSTAGCSSTSPASASTPSSPSSSTCRRSGSRGMGPYVRIGLRETFRYRAGTLPRHARRRGAGHQRAADRVRQRPRVRQPDPARAARAVDDGKLEAMVVEDRGAARAALGGPPPGARHRRQGARA